MKLYCKILVVLILSTTNFCCFKHKNDKSETSKLMNFSGPPSIIYKTKKDYFDKVPVTLSKDKNSITSYPTPKDIYYKGKLALPTILKDGFLLDNRGINVNSAFLSISYDEYSRLASAPSLQELFSLIIDNDPFEAFYNCGNKYQFKNLVEEINVMITNNQLVKCKCFVNCP